MADPQPDPFTFQQLLERMQKIESDNAALKNIAVDASSLSLKLCDRVVKLEADNILLRDQIGTMSAELTNLKLSIESNIQHFSDTFISETAMLKSNIEAVIEQLVGLDKIKDQHTEMVAKTEQQVKTWASLCSNSDSQPLASIDKIVQGKIVDERVRRSRELNLRVRGLPSTHDPLAAGHSFLCDQLGLSEIKLDRCWFGQGDVLFIRFFSLADRLQALRAKRKLFSLPSKIFLDEDLTKTQVAELKHARGIVAKARLDGKWAVIRNLRAVIRDSAPSGWVDRRAPKAK